MLNCLFILPVRAGILAFTQHPVSWENFICCFLQRVFCEKPKSRSLFFIYYFFLWQRVDSQPKAFDFVRLGISLFGLVVLSVSICILPFTYKLPPPPLASFSQTACATFSSDLLAGPGGLKCSEAILSGVLDSWEGNACLGQTSFWALHIICFFFSPFSLAKQVPWASFGGPT